MSTIKFSDLNITTMTVVLQLSQHVNLDTVFPLFEITRVDLPPSKRKVKKSKLPFCDKPGAILSVRYNGVTRGIIRSGSFLNSITVDISISRDKNISIKLSKNKIQMCGATSNEMIYIAANHLINHLSNIQSTLELLREDREKSREMVDWVVENTRGESFLYEERLLTGIVPPPQYPEHFNPTIMDFLYVQAENFISHDDYQLQLNWILTLEDAISGPLEIVNLNKVMVNYNFHLGFNINRKNLADGMNGLYGFHARFDNSVDHSVTIELPYEPEEDSSGVRKKKKVFRHIFLVYKSGLVTQSGPNEILMEEAYNMFNDAIRSIRNYVERPGAIKGLKYRPSFPSVDQVSET